ncbi:glutamate--tRNA ligase [Clavibacter michiganensis]|uniref:glutamate--tRNA ligase n=1 Tax=Clavibacter michiganensis TaxID=28447 RepID=UPI000A3640E7|nr:glutamate--tRNA ligase [Clavibacter michiganensis]KAF0259791.1 Glutamate--tRNA ligase [Clavibacter michiganensis subsp. michiganensis]MDO4098591.1 glutamate--tRNA ligase [Clavibacter michiganensis]MDO4126462.1 glutamate--tRNA ligase [Clavibacter michiganensis]MWJ18362.1 glutamate--tRNA ligase [Clavibacter michiganensis subsp. michiganensis]NIY59998.1 glutamate--tRNA ligase [Clavibacter michiganensis subsp. michiganensis]
MTETTAHPVTTATGTDVRVRFCPSPTGTPHVGLIRTALFNWAYARHTGGKLVFRVEDTDAARDSEESYEQLIEALRWLEIDWDEGEGVGGPHAPYRQSQRTDLYLDVIRKLTESGHLYESYATAEEIEARNRAAGRDPKMGYDNFERDLTEAERQAFRDEGRSPALRLRVPDTDLSFDDLVRGTVTFPAGSFPDFVLVRPNGAPLYTLVNPVDDALMGITHVLRGEDLLSSTPRQIALYHALIDIGVADAIPRFGHLPYVMGEGNKKLSKRDPESNLFHHRDRGFIPEGLINYLALLGWSLTHDRDVFSRMEMVTAFDVADVTPAPARFDLKKAESLNGDHIRLLPVEDFAQRLVPYLQAADVVGAELTHDEQRMLEAAAPLVQERMQLLGEAPDLLSFLFTTADALPYDDAAVQALKDDAPEVLAASRGALAGVPHTQWDIDLVQEVLQNTLITGMGMKPRLAYGPLRVAVSGRRISPPLFESMVLLGKDETIARLDRLAGMLGA